MKAPVPAGAMVQSEPFTRLSGCYSGCYVEKFSNWLAKMCVPLFQGVSNPGWISPLGSFATPGAKFHI